MASTRTIDRQRYQDSGVALFEKYAKKRVFIYETTRKKALDRYKDLSSDIDPDFFNKVQNKRGKIVGSVVLDSCSLLTKKDRDDPELAKKAGLTRKSKVWTDFFDRKGAFYAWHLKYPHVFEHKDKKGTDLFLNENKQTGVIFTITTEAPTYKLPCVRSLVEAADQQY